MRNFILCLILVCGLPFNNAFAKKPRPKLKSILPTHGVLLDFAYNKLEPNHVYTIRLEHAWFGGHIASAPEGLTFSDDRKTLTFRAPALDKGSPFSSENFAIDVYSIINGSPFKFDIFVDVPRDAIAKLILPEYKIVEKFKDDDPDPKKNTDRATITVKDLDGIDGCIPHALSVCSPNDQNSCPATTDPELSTKCYGPLEATFWCCTVDPL